MMMSKFTDNKATKIVQLPKTWSPSELDVICGRGSIALQHAGNQRLRAIVNSMIPQYNACKCKFQKSSLVSSIVDSVQQASPDGGFVKFDSDENAWIRVSERHAREKVGQIFRDSLSGKYKSSTRAKSQRRREKLASNGDDSSGASTSTQQDGLRCESPASLEPPSGAASCLHNAPHFTTCLPGTFPQHPPSVISVNYVNYANIGAANRASTSSAGLTRAGSISQMAILGEIEPLPINSTEDFSLLENLFDLDFVSDESVSFFRALTDKTVDELCDFLFDECL
jgi:hypothetical protein